MKVWLQKCCRSRHVAGGGEQMYVCGRFVSIPLVLCVCLSDDVECTAFVALFVRVSPAASPTPPPPPRPDWSTQTGHVCPTKTRQAMKSLSLPCMDWPPHCEASMDVCASCRFIFLFPLPTLFDEAAGSLVDVPQPAPAICPTQPTTHPPTHTGQRTTPGCRSRRDLR